MTLVLLACLFGATPDDGAVRRGVMHGALDALLALQPYLADEASFRDPKNRATIEDKLTTLVSLEHALPTSLTGVEPGLAALAGALSSYLRNTQAHLRAGHTDFARDRLRSVTQICAGCHTRSFAGRPSLDFSPRVSATNVTPVERARLFVATRQWDAASRAYREALSRPLVDDVRAYAYLQIAREAMSVLIRVRADVDQTSALIEGELLRRDLPIFVRTTLEAWRNDIRAWKAEPFDASKKSPAELVAKAKSLLQKRGVVDALASDEQFDVATLRASGYLHEALARNPGIAERGEALLLLAVCANSIRDPLLWDLQEIYLEACIRETPKSAMAKQCYLRLLDRIYLDYTGSAGTDVPPDVLERTSTLRNLAY